MSNLVKQLEQSNFADGDSFEGDDGKTYIKMFSAPTASMVSYSEGGYHSLSNFEVLETGNNGLTIGDGFCKVEGNPYCSWIEVPVLDAGGKETPQAKEAWEIVQALNDYPVLDEAKYLQEESNREAETFEDVLYSSGEDLPNYDELIENDDFVAAVLYLLREEAAFVDNGTHLRSGRLEAAWKAVISEGEETGSYAL